MTLSKRNPASYQKYDEVINCVLKSIALARTGGRFAPITCRDFDLKHMIKPLHLRVMRIDSIPTGTLAAEAIVFEVFSFTDPLVNAARKFQIKYNQITNTVGFNLTNEYDRDFDHCVFVCQNDNIDEIKKHIDKVMYDFVVKDKLFSLTGELLDFEDFTARHVTLLSMISI